MRNSIKYKTLEIIDKYNLKGKVLEIGAYKLELSSKKIFSNNTRFQYFSLDLEDNEIPSNIIGDVTNLHDVFDDNTFDIVFCADVFEHIKEPWKAAKEIERILKPNGIAFIFTVWSWRYHPLPIDYWRFSHEALQYLFSNMETIESAFDTSLRREDIRGFWKNKKDSVPIDSLGGWRENWGVYYIGKKISNLTKKMSNNNKKGYITPKKLDDFFSDDLVKKYEQTISDLLINLDTLKEKNSYHYTQMIEYKEKASRQHNSIEELKEKNSYHYTRMIEYKEKASRQHNSIEKLNQTIEELNQQYSRLLNSKVYKVGLIITLPFRFINIFNKRRNL